MKSIKVNILIVCIILISSMAIIVEATASTYYASPNGEGTSCSTTSPCTPEYAIDIKSRPGDTILLKSGTYKGADYMIDVDSSGTSGRPKTIKAEYDGQVIIDGEGNRRPCYVYQQSWINIEGIICKNSNDATVMVSGGSSNVNVRRVSAYNETVDAGHFLASKSSNILFEDVAGLGKGRITFEALQSSHITFRRAWSKWSGYTPDSPTQPRSVYNAYASSHVHFENCIATMLPDAPNGSLLRGFYINNKFSSEWGDYNKIYGGIAVEIPYYNYIIDNEPDLIMTGNVISNSVSIDPLTKQAILQQGDDNLTINQFTSINAAIEGIKSQYATGYGTISGTLKNSVFVGAIDEAIKVGSGTSLTHINNSYFNNKGTASYSDDFYKTSIHETELNVNPFYATTTYGNGAYLIRPSNLAKSGEGGTYVGAEVLYRYQNGQLTNVPLWPWPMEARICKETGYSVTYENGCTKGGGLWKTLKDVYSDSGSNPSDAPPNPPILE